MTRTYAELLREARTEIREVTPAEALNLYERNWRHIEQAALAPHERALIHSLVANLGGSRLLV